MIFNRIILCFAFLATSAYGIDRKFYCSSNSTLRHPQIIKIDSSDLIYQITTRYENEAKYQDNMLCTWQIEAPKNYRIELFDIKVDLPYVPVYSSCNLNDYLQVDNVNENSILQLCRKNSIKFILSSDERLFIKFQTNNINNDKGIEFSIRIWDINSSCPKNWFKTKDNECFRIYDPDVKLPLDESQAYCNYAQANLASFDSQQEINDFLVYAFEKKLIKSRTAYWIGLNDIEQPGTLAWLEDGKKFDPNFKDKEVKKDGANGDKNCVVLDVPTDSDPAVPTYEFSRVSCTQKTVIFPFICKMNQTEVTRILTIPTEPNLKDTQDNILAIFLKIGFPILAILIGICLILLVLFSVKLEKSCSQNNICIARLSTYVAVTILSILFIILFIMGILTRRNFVLAVGIPILILIFFTIMFIICMDIRKSRDRNDSDRAARAKHEQNVNETELQQLKPHESKTNELPSYDQATNS